MRYLVRARVKSNCGRALLDAIERRALGRGSVAEGEYLRNMAELTRVQDAHGKPCRDRDGTEPWACAGCDCTERLERKLVARGEGFVDRLRRENGAR